MSASVARLSAVSVASRLAARRAAIGLVVAKPSVAYSARSVAHNSQRREATPAPSSSRSYSSSAAGSGVNALVLGEVDASGALTNATLSTITAANQLGGSVTVLLLGSNAAKAAETAKTLAGVTKVAIAAAGSDGSDLEHGAAEHLSPYIRHAVAQFGSTHVLASATTVGKNVLPRVAFHLDSQPISEVIAIKGADTFVRPIYAGNALSTVKSSDVIKTMTVRATSFEKAVAGNGSAEVVQLSKPASAAPEASNAWVSDEQKASDRPDLTSARVIVSGGRGLKSGENFGLLYTLADKFGAAVGASRAAVDAGYVSNDLQIGQTGKIVAPELYIAVGISGAIQHLAGMKDSKTIVAINKDADAPIFQVSDFGLVADLFEAVPDMTKKL